MRLVSCVVYIACSDSIIVHFPAYHADGVKGCSDRCPPKEIAHCTAVAGIYLHCYNIVQLTVVLALGSLGGATVQTN